MQRSSSLAGGAGATPRGAGHYSSPWSSGARLDVSTASVKDSECGSTSSVLTAATVYSRTRSLVGFEVSDSERKNKNKGARHDRTGLL
jgi:hypothetical protein